MRAFILIAAWTGCAALILIAPCRAQRAIYAPPDNVKWCRGGGFPHEGPAFGLARVVSDTSHFVKDWDNVNCPEASNCTEKAYLVKGDVVATTRSYKQWTCATWPKNGYTEWMNAADLTPIAVAAHPDLKSWLGTWVNGKGSDANSIRLSRGKAAGALAVNGDACWGRGCSHTGSIAATATPDGNTVAFAEGDPDACHLSLVLLGPYLVATDDNQCGGMNVSFSAVYYRAR
jgi:hypothetical protein